jgi:enamine deaminase RidA (YjgF/YER057c/UK114 family)
MCAFDKRRSVSTGSPYEPIIGFSRPVRVGAFISVSATAPIGSDGNTVAPGDSVTQARRCFEIVKSAIEQLGAAFSDVIRTRIYLLRIEDWKSVGEVHGEYFKKIRPASTIIQVSRFVDPDWLVEIEVDAVIQQA